jgi:hypothetical protein
VDEYECIVGHHKTTEEQAAKLEDSACCVPCAVAHNHPGKFEKWSYRELEDFRNHGMEDMGKALILYAWSLDSGEDNHMSNEGWGYCGMFGKFLLTENTQGFIDFDEYKDVSEAQAEFDRLYSDGWGADESDYYLQFDNRRGRYTAYDGDAGKEIEVWEDAHGEIGRRRALASISRHMRKTGYFPSIWEVGERGDVTDISKEVW